MRTRIVRAALAFAALAATAALATGCEMLVQLDRSAVAGDDGGCPICADGGDDGDDGGTTLDGDVSTNDSGD